MAFNCGWISNTSMNGQIQDKTLSFDEMASINNGSVLNPNISLGHTFSNLTNINCTDATLLLGNASLAFNNDMTNGNTSSTSWVISQEVFVIWDIVDKLLAIITNGGTLLIVYRHRYHMLEIPSNIFISCLTLADLLSATALPFSICSVYLPPGIAWTISCVVTILLNLITSMVNTVILCVIALDRLIYMVYPLDYHTRVTTERAWFAVYVIWPLTVIYNTIVIVTGYRDAYPDGTVARPCNAAFSVQGGSRWFIFYVFVVFVPITIGSYIRIGLIALKQHNSIVNNQGGGNGTTAEVASQNTTNHPPGVGPNHKITKVMLNILLLYISCLITVSLFPAFIMSLDEGVKEVAFKVANMIWRMNQWLNPIIYMWKSKKFRFYVKRFFGATGAQPNDGFII